MGYITQANIGGSDYKLAGALWGTCTTQAATAAKVVTCADFDDFETGVTIAIAFTYANSSAATLNVNSKGAKNAYSAGTGAPQWAANSVVTFTYNGTNWIQNDFQPDTKNTTGTEGTVEKIYLVGAKSNPASGYNETYSNGNLYATNGNLYANSFNGVKISSVGDDITLQIGSSQTPTTTLIVPVGSFRSLHEACEKNVDDAITAGSTSTNLPTTQAVVEYIATQAAGAATFQGTLVQTDSGSSSTKWTQVELEAASYKKGWYWVAEEEGTYAGNKMEVGDMLFCVSDKSGTTYAASDFAAIQNNIETLTNTEIDALWAAA